MNDVLLFLKVVAITYVGVLLGLFLLLMSADIYQRLRHSKKKRAYSLSSRVTRDILKALENAERG